jgi:hypothetical protein
MSAKRLTHAIAISLTFSAALLAAPSAVRAGDYWAAVAICPNCRSISWSYRYSTASAAQKAAFDRVRRKHSSANLLLVTSKPYVAVARSAAGGYGTGYGNSRSEADGAARRSCLKWNLTVAKVDVIKNNNYDDRVIIVDPVNPAWSSW